MGRGTRQDNSNLLRPDNQLDSREVIFKSAGRGQSTIKQAEREEAEKFALARKQKEAEQTPPTETDEDGNRYWKNSAGELHRDGDLPAREWANGTREWWFEGKRHRDGDKPAVEYANGDHAWYQQGKFHREGDQPAWERTDGTREWWKQGTRHRDGDKPAVEWSNGSREWYQRGKRHRDGNKPAIEKANGSREWWQNGEFVREEKPKEG